MIRLGVNVDHVATVRQARRIAEPDPVEGALLAVSGGADQITCHLREDRRHIDDRDLRVLRQVVHVPLNMEMAATPEMIEIALDVRPDVVTLVPERREEVTTEGGLDVAGHRTNVADAVRRLRDAGLRVSLFIDPDLAQLKAAHKVDAHAVEFHTGRYADALGLESRRKELDKLITAAKTAAGLHIGVVAGHGLNRHNVAAVAAIEEFEELNIGHSIVGRAIMVGMERAVREMKDAMVAARYDLRRRGR